MRGVPASAGGGHAAAVVVVTEGQEILSLDAGAVRSVAAAIQLYYTGMSVYMYN